MKRRYFQDVGLAKIYTPEELGAVVDADGKVIDSNNPFDREAARKEMKRLMAKWYPDTEKQMAIWFKYKEEKDVAAKVPGDLTNDEYAKYVEWADPVNFEGNIQEGEFVDSGVDSDSDDTFLGDNPEDDAQDLDDREHEADKIRRDNPPPESE